MVPQDTRFLVADDMKTSRAFMKGILAGLGYRDVLEAQNGAVALEVISAQFSGGSPIQLVLSDWHMPQLSGIELLRKLRQTPEFSALPLILVTTEGDPAQIRLATELGVSNYLLKPFGAEDLRRVLEATWGRCGIQVETRDPAAIPGTGLLEELIAAVSSTFAQMLHTQVTPKRSFTRGEEELMAADIAAVAGFNTTHLHGSIIFGVPKSTYLNLMARYFGEAPGSQNFETRDGASEVLNVIMGKMRAVLSTEDSAMRKAIPSTLLGKQVAVLPSFEKRSVILPYDTDVGPFYIELMITNERP